MSCRWDGGSWGARIGRRVAGLRRGLRRREEIIKLQNAKYKIYFSPALLLFNDFFSFNVHISHHNYFSITLS